MAQQNPFLASPLETVTDRIQQDRFELPPLPQEEAAAPAIQQVAAPKPAKAAKKSSGDDDYAPPPDLRPLFETAARKYNVPVNVLMALGHQESRFNPTAIGVPTQWGRAKGMMQYLDDTAGRMGINPFDPEQAVSAAAKQMRERLDKGYTMEEAVKAHFAGDDRKKWKDKTAAYGNEVLQKAARIADSLYPFDQSPEEVARRDRQRTEIEAQEVERQRMQQPAATGLPQQQPPRERTWGEVASDTGVQLAEGVNNIFGAVPNLVSPEGEVAAFFNRNAEYWSGQQSEPLKQKIEAANAKISEAGKDGILAQMSEAASTYFTDPSLAARFITTNLPSMIPGIAAAKVAQAAAIARGATAAKAAAAATTAAGAANAALNAGGARGEAFKDIKQTLMQQGLTEEQATEQALKDSRVVAAVGAATGYLSGKTGLESALVGKQGANSAVRAGLGAGVAELAGEQAEEVLPKVTTNYQAGQYDKRSLGQDVGRTIVETAIGSGPGAAVSGGVAAMNARGQQSGPQPVSVQGQQPEFDMPPEGSAFADTGAQSNPLEQRAPTVEGDWIPAGDYLPTWVAEEQQDAPAGPMTSALENAADQQQAAALPPAGPLTSALEKAAAKASPQPASQPGALPAPQPEQETSPEPIKQKADGFEVGQKWKGTSGTTYVIDSVSPDGKLAQARFPNGYTAAVHFDAEVANGWQRDDQDSNAPDSEKKAAQPYASRYQSRIEAIKQAKTPDEVKAILGDEYGDNERHMEGTGLVEREARKRTREFEQTSAKKTEQDALGRGEWVSAVDGSMARSKAESEAAKLNQQGDGFEYAAQPDNYDGYAVMKRKADDLPAKPANLEDMTEKDLRARLKYLAGQAKSTGGWNKMLMDERRKIERQIEKMSEASQPQAKQGADAEKPAAPTAPSEQGKDEYAGKWFGSAEKAQAFIDKKKAGATHEAVQTGKVRWEIKPKQADAKPELKDGAKVGVSFTSPDRVETATVIGQPYNDQIRGEAVQVALESGGSVIVSANRITAAPNKQQAAKPAQLDDINVADSATVKESLTAEPAKEVPNLAPEAAQEADAYADRWAQATTVQREAAAQSAGVPEKLMNRVVNGGWDYVGSTIYGKKIRAALDGKPQAEAKPITVKKSAGVTTIIIDPSSGQKPAKQPAAQVATPSEEMKAEAKQPAANLPAARSAAKAAEVVDAPVENPDELIKAIADAVRGDAQVRFVKDKDTGRFNLSIKGLFIGTIDKQPAKAEEALAVAARRYMDALAAAGRTMPQDPRQMTRDQFVAVNGLAGLVQDFEVTGPIDAEGSGVKVGDNGLFYTDHDALYDRIQAEANKTGGEENLFSAKAELKEPKTLDELIGAIDAGYRVHYDYQGVGGTTMWLEKADNGWTLKSKDDDSAAVITKGGAGPRGGWNKSQALSAAEQNASYRFNTWSPTVERRLQPGEPGYTLDMAEADLAAMQNNTGESWVAQDARVTDRIKRQEKLIEEMKAEQSKGEEYGANNKLVSRERAAELRDRLKKKLSGTQLNSGIDPELLAIGTELAVFHLEAGARKFAEFAKAIASDLDMPVSSLRPFLRSWYNGARDMMEDNGVSVAGMDSADVVREELAKLDAAKPDATITEEVKQNDRNADQAAPAGGAGNRALEGVPAGQVRGAESSGDAEQRGAEGGRTDAGRAGKADRAGFSARGGMGSGARNVSVPAGRSGGKRGGAGQSGVQAATATEQADAGTVAEQRAAETAEARKAPVAGDYRITDLTRLGEGGQKTKFRNNVAAIRLLNELQRTGRPATAEEQNTLARYVGWGGIPQAFDKDNAEWSKEYAELKELLTPEEWDSANESTQYAHYTSQEIITSMYDALKRMGFTGGKMMEPGSGVGNFMGLMPDDLRSSSRFTAVERERIAGGIAKLLYPNQNVQQQDFRKFHAQDGYFDVAIGNPPFASQPLTDLTGRKHLSGLSVHNYFFAKSVDMLREGGILAMVVSNSFMDAKRDKARQYIGERTELLGAIRLPNNAFAKNANTEVTTDIIFLRKRPESEWGSKAAREDMKRWLNISSVPDPLGGELIPLNQYFIDNPQMMLGRMERSGTMYRAGQTALVAREGQDTAALLKQAINRLPENVFTPAVVKNTAAMQEAEVTALADDAKVDVGGHYVKDGELFVRLGDVAGEGRAMKITATTKISEKRELGKNGLERLKQLADMRVTVRKLLAAEIADAPNMEELRTKLNQQYDSYVKEFGYINQRTTVQLFGDDPDFPLLASLEHGFDPGIGAAAAKSQGVKAVPASAKKAPIFSRRVIEKHEEITKADTPEDALMVSIAERGQIDPGYIGSLLGRDGAAVLEELTKGDKPALFIDPATGGYVLRDAYLSGNVRKKLEQAKSAGMYGNVAELEKVIPEDIPAHEISGKIGAPWVPASVYEEFAQEIMGEGTKARVVYVPAVSSYIADFKPGSEVANTNTYGTTRMGAADIFAALLNSKEIKVGYYEEDPATGSRRFVLEKDATDEANDKAREIKDKFNDWLFADAERAEKMQRAYNDAVNNYVTRVFDGSMLKFPGKVPDAIIKLRRHQRNAVARIVQDGTALLDHVVGAGKTFTVIAAAMELKRTGLAKKPMIVVPNHLVKQWAADFYRLYPGANILTATKKDFEKANRRKFLAKIATGNWDAVIMAHSSFGFIKPDAEFELRFNQERIDEIIGAIDQLEKEGGQESKRTVKQLAKMKEGLENKLAALRDKPMDDLLDFGQIGVDHVFVDEAHLFKNLMFVTKMQNVRGLGQPKGSQRAYDMFIKTHQIYQQNGNGRGVVFATGTPVSNSLAEMYHMLRYLAPQTLLDSGQFTFDAWAKTYADVEQVWMQSMSGDGYKASNRMSRFVNTPELLRVFDQVADTVTIDDIKQAYAEENNGAEFPIPKLKNGRRTPVSIPRSQAQTDYMAEVADRAKQLEQRKGKPQKGEDNMLSIMGDARKAAMDIRMVRPDIKGRDPNGRIAIAARNIMERYQRYNDVRGTQLVFSDMGTPKKQAEKELKEYNELMAAAAPLSDEQVLAMAELGDEAAQEALEKAEEAQRKIDAKGQDWMDAIQAAMRGFSVYDDLKDALVEMGIPENEIAFIHDYNTDDQKAALFRAVNDGKVRVLLGSTEKMGAGTNVQERAVALHHLDVPWKPSDIEQREGRVIRQGNKLLDLIPGFEVEVMAYATQDTLDLFMWQTQEKKLSMIAQLRTGNVGREVDNAFEEMQMSAGEMQAAATSNPYLLEEIQLKDKVKRLERQKRSFDGQRNDLLNRRKRAERDIEQLPSQIKAAEKIEATAVKALAGIDEHFAGLQATVNGQTVTGAANIRNAVRDAVNNSPAEDKDGKEVRKISIEFNGKEYTSQSGLADAVNKELGDAAQIAYTLPDGKTVYRAAEVAAELVDPVANMMEAETDQTELGKVGDFEVTAYRIGADSIEVSISLNGDEVSSYEARFDLKELSTLTNTLRAIPNRIQQALVSMRGNAAYLRSKLERAKKNLADIASKPADGEWEGEAELKKAREDYRAVIKKLAEREDTQEPAGNEPRYSINAEGLAEGEFGPITEEYRNDPAGAVQWLQENQTGEAIIDHPTLGEISLIWGDGTMGLSHIAARRGENFLSRIPAILQSAEVYEKENQKGRVFLGNEADEATIRLDWNGQAKAWLVSAYEKYGDAKQSAKPRQANRSGVVNKRSGKMSVDDLRAEITAGPVGQVIARLIDNGRIVLHANAETLPQAARGKRGVQAVTLANGQIHLVANRLTKDNARPVLLHEMFHMGGEALVGSKEWGNLMGRLGSLKRQASSSAGKMNEFFQRANDRVEAARQQGAVSTGMTVEEFGAYAIEEYEQKRDSLPAVIRKWVEDLIGTIKAYVLQRYGKQLGDVTPAQLAAMAKLVIMNAAVMAERGQPSNATGKFSVAPEQPNSQRAKRNREAVEKNQDAYADAKAAQGAEFNRFAGIVDQAGRNVVKGINALRTTWGLVSDNQKAIPAIRDAYDLEGKMDGRRIGIATEASKAFGRDFSEMAIKDPATADKLADLMTQATLWQIKPDKPKNDRWRSEWQAKYDELRAMWDALPQEAKDLYDATQKFYEARSKDIHNALKERIMALEIGEKQKRDMLAELQARFDRELGTGPYFPLARFGSYLVIGVKGEGDNAQRVVMNAEYAPEAEAMAAELRRRGYEVNTKMAKDQAQDQDMRQSSELVRKIAEMIEMQVPDFIAAPMLDELNQIFLDALPLASARKSFIHRKNVAGFSRDMARALNQSAVKLAGQIAKLEYAQKIEEAFVKADKQAESAPDNFDLQPVVAEMRKRFESTMRFKTNPVAAALQQAGFAFTLAYNLSSAAVNLLQMTIAGGHMGARHGAVKANAQIAKALGEIATTAKQRDKNAHIFDLRKPGSPLNDGEKKMLETLEKSGKIDVTAAMDAYRAAHEDTKQIAGSKFGRVMQKVLDGMGVFMQAAEVVNRQAVALAAYRMELQKTDGDVDAAIKYAAEVLDDTQFNMNISNQPRFMHNNAVRVVMQYKGFAINMMDYLGRTMRTAMDGMDKGERRQAAKALGMIFAAQVALAGIGSLPLYIGAAAVGAKAGGAAAGAAGGGMGAARLAKVLGGGVGALALSAFLNGAFGDDDEPWDWKADMRRWLAENTNATFAQFLDRGLFSIAGVDIADRISMNGLMLRDLQEQHGKKAWQNMAEEAALGMGGVAMSKFYLGGARALDALEQGNTKDAFISMLPVALANLLKGADMAANGVTDKRTGAKLMDVNAGEAMVQMFGFQPSDVRERRWADNVAYNADKQMQDRKSRLLDGIAKAMLADDSKAEDAAWEAAERWNDKNADLYNPITMRDVNNRVRQLEDQRSMMEGEARTKGQRQQLERQGVFKRGLGGQ